MKNYYYLGASLPGLHFPDAPPISSVEFEARCAENLSEADFKLLQAVRLFPDASNHPAGIVAAKFWNWDVNLRNALLIQRLPGNEVEKYTRDETDYFSEIEAIIQDVNNKANPLEKELAIDKFRFAEIENLSANQEFNIEYFCAYKLKLELIEKYSNLNIETGEKNFLEAVDKIVDSQKGRTGAL